MTANLTIAQTVARWKALEPPKRRRLLVHIAKLLAMVVVLYVIMAVIFQAWWWPAVAIALSLVASSLVQRFKRSPRSRN